jgi:hypothetical protein
MQRTNPIAGMTADEDSPNEATGQNVILEKKKSDLSASSE